MSGFSMERLMGLESATFCMASAREPLPGELRLAAVKPFAARCGSRHWPNGPIALAGGTGRFAVASR